MFGMMLKAQRDMMDLWRKSAETATASAFVVQKRVGMMGNPSVADMGELSRMVPEKMAAFGLANMAMMQAFWAGASPAAGMSAGLKPIHASATANAKRLRKAR